MGTDILAKVHQACSESEFLRAVASVRRDGGRRFALGEVGLRPLSSKEVARLERLGNEADDWSRVRVAEGFDPGRVRGSTFQGDVVLGRFAGSVRVAEGVELSAGVYNSTLVDCVVGHNALVRDVRLLANYAVGESAVLLDCGRITCGAETVFGNGTALPVALEGGGRDVAVYAEIDVEVASAVAAPRDGRGWLADYAAAVAEYRSRVTSSRGLIGPNALVQGTDTVRNAYLGPHARVDGATLVTESTLLSREGEPVVVASGACVDGSLLQWGSRVTTMALVSRSVLTEYSHAERHGKVTDSILGPNTGVAAGEVTSCLLGPFVGCHHQSLLISTFWPAGRGNVGYGANAGSNHTSRAPDQEFWPGEGMFLGLGVNVKFPADFSRAPYTVVACGTTLLPQKVTFPFSLIRTPSDHCPGVPIAFNQILPAWGLAENVYALRRNEAKYQARNKARRARFDFRVFRPETVDLMRDACGRLEAIREVKEWYTERDIPGLGKNVLLEDHRRQAIEAYQFYTLYYALLGLAERTRAVVEEGHQRVHHRLLTTPSEDARWEHQRQILTGDPDLVDTASGLRLLPWMLEKVARDVEQSKARDDARGGRIIEDYDEVHVQAERDDCVRRAWEEAGQRQAEVQSLLAALNRHLEEQSAVA